MNKGGDRIMQDTEYKGVNTLLRVYETKLLTRDDYERLLKANDLREALEVLKATDYSFDQDNVLDDKNFDAFLMRHLSNIYQELYAVTPDSEVIQLFTLRYSYHNVKVLLKQRFTETDLEHLIIPIGKYPLSMLKNLVTTEQSHELNEVLVEGVHEAIEHFETYGRMEAADVFMDTYYYKQMRYITDRLNDPTINKITDALIDLGNLSTVVRSVNQNKSRSFLHTVLSSSGSIAKKDIIDQANEGSVAVLNNLYMDKAYSNRFEDILDKSKKTINPLSLDKVIEDIIHELMQEGMYQAFGPMPAMAYMFAIEKEITNIRLILVGKDNQIAEDILRERMRPIYGS